MVTITATDVNKLRQITGAGMMDCKTALVEAEGDYDKAIDILRKKGQKVASKRADREASEGVIIANTTKDAKRGIIIMLNCETDFVANNQEFIDFANSIAKCAIDNKPASLESLIKLNVDDLPISEKLNELIGKIGEKIELSKYETIEANKVFAYIHPGNRFSFYRWLEQRSF